MVRRQKSSCKSNIRTPLAIPKNIVYSDNSSSASSSSIVNSSSKESDYTGSDFEESNAHICSNDKFESNEAHEQQVDVADIAPVHPVSIDWSDPIIQYCRHYQVNPLCVPMESVLDVMCNDEHAKRHSNALVQFMYSSGDSLSYPIYFAPLPDIYNLFLSNVHVIKKLFRFNNTVEYITPTAVQSVLWTMVSRYCDVLAIAPAGSGKTWAYLLPSLLLCFDAWLASLASEFISKPLIVPTQLFISPTVIVLVPTRELATQVFANLIKSDAAGILSSTSHCLFHQSTALKSMCITGGTSIDLQLLEFKNIYETYMSPSASCSCKSACTSNTDIPCVRFGILIATPGRLVDLLTQQQQQQSLVLSFITTCLLVIDEADKMMQMGFHKDLNMIRSHVHPDTRTWMFSATMPIISDSSHQHCKIEILQNIKSWLIHTPVCFQIISVENEKEVVNDSGVNISSDIIQTVHVVAEHKKARKLIGLLKKLNDEDQKNNKSNRQGTSILIFVNRIAKGIYIHRLLQREGYRVGLIHGDLSQPIRELTLSDFTCGKTAILVTTDVLGRGVHIPRLGGVILVDFPPSLEQYAHRVGRVGRLGQHKISNNDESQIICRSWAFFTRNLKPLASGLISILRSTNQVIDPNLSKLLEEKSDDENSDENDVEDNENEDNMVPVVAVSDHHLNSLGDNLRLSRSNETIAACGTISSSNVGHDKVRKGKFKRPRGKRIKGKGSKK